MPDQNDMPAPNPDAPVPYTPTGDMPPETFPENPPQPPPPDEQDDEEDEE